MRFRKIIYFILTFVFMAASVAPNTEAYAKKSRTSQTSKKKNTSKRKSSAKSGTKKKGKGKGKGNKNTGKTKTKKKSKTGRGASSSKSTAPAPEVILNDSLTMLVNAAVLSSISENSNPGGLRVNAVRPDKLAKQVKVQLNENFTFMKVSKDLIAEFESTVKKVLPDSIGDFNVSLKVGDKSLAYYIATIDKLPAKYQKNTPFVVPASPYINPRKGMEGDIVALWHSHGRYFSGSGWSWQRPFLFQTAEDIYTMSYVLPFLVPMLENAGAYVMLPRERDINVNEVIVDNDKNPLGEIYSQTTYKEMNGSKQWSTGELEGFIYDLPDFRDTENPFENGTYRQAETVKGGKASVAAWYADIPEDGEYAVYVSYKSLPNSTTDAHYTVNYSGGAREFRVNQTMGGGTWIYLGTFPFKAGYSDKTPLLTLSNISEKGGNTIVTADAVKIGGGMGNIARSSRRSDIYFDSSAPVDEIAQVNIDEEEEVSDGDEEDDETVDGEDDQEEDSEEELVAEATETTVAPTSTEIQKVAPKFYTSGLPRYLEGARYWLHWAGFPESVYSPFHGSDDYKDDYTSRGHWVNYLAGGSRVLPDREGLGIPVDVSFALHTDAGKRADDSIVGTLGICYTNEGARYADGTPRINSRILTNMIQSQIVGDIRKLYDSNWTRRSIWDKSYLEARVPEVPSTLIELLSHQNFGDMQYGLDPNFRFDVSRAIYKSIGRYISERKDREFIVQPLPIANFMIERDKKGVYRLSWSPVDDPLEPSAKPNKYIIMERTEGDLGFKRIGETTSNKFEIKVNDNKIHSVRVLAANEGGLSFPSETLSFREGANGKPILIINGFTRVSGPGHFSESGRAGFNSEEDFGVPYIFDIGFSGYQQEFNRSAGEGFGKSGSSYANKTIAGNTFDYPMTHGEAIAASGRGFVSSSVGAVENGKINLSDYNVVDLILGKQKMTVTGHGKSGLRYASIPQRLQEELTKYVSKGGDLIVSGQYIASDLFDYRAGVHGSTFATGTLGLSAESATANSRSGKINVGYVPGASSLNPSVLKYSNTLNSDYYIVECPDALVPEEGSDALPFITFTDTGETAGLIIKNGKSNIIVMSIPFESITTVPERTSFMTGLLDYLDKN